MLRRDNSIAVLPISNLSTNEEDGLFCDGITEEIINSLSKIKGAFVTSKTSSFYFKDQKLDITEIAQKLGVKYIVEGSMRRSGDQVRITIQLINAQEDYHYWSENFDRKLKNIFEIQDEISLEVKERFREVIGHFDIELHQLDDNRSFEAYELILRAKRISTDLSESGVSQGFTMIEQAISLAPNYDQAHAVKAGYIIALGLIGAWPLAESCKQALESADHALSLNPKNAEALGVKGLIEFVLTGNLTKTYAYLDKAVSIGLTDSGPLLFKALCCSATGDYDCAMESIDIATERDPFSFLPSYFRCVSLLRLRQYEEAENEVDKVLAKFPNHLNIYHIKGQIFLRTGRYKLALAHFTKMPISDNKKVPYYCGLAQAFALLGNLSEAEENIDLALEHDHQLKLTNKENPEVIVNFLLGKFEEGFKHLEADVRSNKYYLRFYRCNPFFDPIIEDPRAKILEQVIFEETDQKIDNHSKYAKSGFGEKEIQTLGKKLSDLMHNEKPFLDPQLSLKKLAEMMDISPNKLSQVINSQKDKNFFDFVNSYRIRELTELLKEDENKQYTILSLALDAGFNSKSTFNASFKKLTGLTPSEYLKSIDKAPLDKEV